MPQSVFCNRNRELWRFTNQKFLIFARDFSQFFTLLILIIKTNFPIFMHHLLLYGIVIIFLSGKTCEYIGNAKMKCGCPVETYWPRVKITNPFASWIITILYLFSEDIFVGLWPIIFMLNVLIFRLENYIVKIILQSITEWIKSSYRYWIMLLC